MKSKLLVLFLLFALLFSFVSCGATPQTEPLAGTTEPPRVTKSLGPFPSNRPGNAPIPEDKNVCSLWIPFRFQTISDMEYYLRTGSQNPAEYAYPTKPIITSFQYGSYYTDLTAYLSPLSYFHIRENDFTVHKAQFIPFINGSTSYLFTFDRPCSVEIAATTATSASDYLMKLHPELTADDFVDYSPAVTYSPKFEIRRIGELEIVYESVYNVRNGAYYVTDDGFMIRVTAQTLEDTLDAAERSDFFTLEKFAPFAVFFSESDTELANAIARFGTQQE